MSINVVVNHSAKADGAKRAASALRAGSADTAARLLTERAITLSGDVNGSGTFDGTKALEIVTTLAKESGVVDGNVSNPDAWWVKLGGKIPLIIQGGVYREHTSLVKVSFPISFKQCLFAIATPYSNAAWSHPIATKYYTNINVEFLPSVSWDYSDKVLWLTLGS